MQSGWEWRKVARSSDERGLQLNVSNSEVKSWGGEGAGRHHDSKMPAPQNREGVRAKTSSAPGTQSRSG